MWAVPERAEVSAARSEQLKACYGSPRLGQSWRSRPIWLRIVLVVLGLAGITLTALIGWHPL